jgi:hypothetical protein
MLFYPQTSLFSVVRLTLAVLLFLFFLSPTQGADAILFKRGGKLLLKGGEADSDSGDEHTVTIADVRVEHQLGLI